VKQTNAEPIIIILLTKYILQPDLLAIFNDEVIENLHGQFFSHKLVVQTQIQAFNSNERDQLHFVCSNHVADPKLLLC